MAVTQESFAPDAAIGTSFGFTSSNIALPGTPATDAMVRVYNAGPNNIAVKLGTTIAVTVTSSTGLMVGAGQVAFLTIGANLFIAGVSCGGPSTASTVNVTTGN